ncbi:YrhB domain-containing protein [Nocardia sp. NBC_00511]|uniref:YrhB domain-containing protein n=1 Tax=Nocardia sp. NBC_00511 TaxID=2903591 RepID=UPI0030E4E888
MDEPAARSLAARHLEGISSPERLLMLFPSSKDLGWCFTFGWNTQRYLETRNMSDSMGPGTGPIVVVKSTGDIWMLSSATSFDEQLAAYAQSRGIDTTV